MTTADWAFVVSILSMLISLGGFVWNVWSKFIYPKPRVNVGFTFSTIFQVGNPKLHDRKVLSLSATNMGPAAVTLHSCIAWRKRRWWEWKKLGRDFRLLNPLHDFPNQVEKSIGPFGGGLPKKLEIGEQFSAYLVANHEPLSKDDYDRIGFDDTFGRLHSASLRQIQETRNRIREHIKDVGPSRS
jgi:hypothetical protein